MSLGKILIVDDDPQIRRVMKMTLTGEGYEVAEARSGEEAQEELRKSQYDLMLLDMNMPGEGGFETCKAVRRFSDISIIVLTVRNTEQDKVNALDAGADDFITKPFSSPELLARIRAVLRRSSAPPEGGPRQLTLDGVEIDFQARVRWFAAKNCDLHLERIRSAALPGDESKSRHSAPRTAAGGMGTGLRRPGGVPARFHKTTAPEN